MQGLNRGQGIRVFIATCAAKDLYSVPIELYTLPGFAPEDVKSGSGEEKIPGGHSGSVPLPRQAPKVLQDSRQKFSDDSFPAIPYGISEQLGHADQRSLQTFSAQRGG